MAERIRHRIEEASLAEESGQIPVTVSIGIACTEESDQDKDALLYKANQAMYKAKEQGRNLVRSYS